MWVINKLGSQCRLLLSLETPIDVWSVAIQVTMKGSDQSAHVHRLVWAFAGLTYHIVEYPMSRLNFVDNCADNCIKWDTDSYKSEDFLYIYCILKCLYMLLFVQNIQIKYV